MFRLSPRRSQRSKGFKVKHALQLCVLLGVCIWLVYQLKNSKEKKSSYVESTKTTSEVVNFGRKDLHPRVEETSVVDARHKEEDEEEEQEENKQEEQHKLDDVSGVQDEVLKHEQNDNEENSEHKQDSVDQETEENSENALTQVEGEQHNEKLGEENDNIDNKESESTLKLRSEYRTKHVI